MHIESSITAVSWIPVGSVTGLARVPTTDTNFGNWFATYYGTATPWGGPDLEPLGLQEIAPQVERAVA